VFRKLAVIANLKSLGPVKKTLLGLGGLGAAGLGIREYLDSVSMPPSDELLMMDLPSVPGEEEGKEAALVNDIPAANTAMTPAPVPKVPAPPIGMNAKDMFGTKSTNPTPLLSSAAPSGESSNPRSEAVSATGSKQTSSGKAQGIKNAAFLGGGILPAAVGGIGGYLAGEHFLAPYFAHQQTAIAEQLSHGEQALATAARNQSISPILAAAAGALLLSWLLAGNKEEKVRESMGGKGEYATGLQGFNPEEQKHLSSGSPHSLGY
jgi:hypothetical protein